MSRSQRIAGLCVVLASAAFVGGVATRHTQADPREPQKFPANTSEVLAVNELQREVDEAMKRVTTEAHSRLERENGLPTSAPIFYNQQERVWICPGDVRPTDIATVATDAIHRGR